MPIVVHTQGPGRAPEPGQAGPRTITFSGLWLLVPMLLVAAVVIPFAVVAGLVILACLLAYVAFRLIRILLAYHRLHREIARAVRASTVEDVRTGSSPFDDRWPGGERP